MVPLGRFRMHDGTGSPPDPDDRYVVEGTLGPKPPTGVPLSPISQRPVSPMTGQVSRISVVQVCFGVTASHRLCEPTMLILT